MITIKQTKFKIWWNNEGEDFPDLKILNDFNNSFTDSIYKLNYLNQFSAQVVIKDSKDLDITAFKTVSTGNFDNQVYIIKSIHKKTPGGIIILDLVIDVFSTHAYKLLELPNKFLTKRTHKFNKLSFQMEDSLLNTIPIYYEKNQIVEKRYTDSNGEYSPTNLTKINVFSSPGVSYVSDFISNTNANIYYVFGCGVDSITDTTKYTLIPYTDGGVLYFPSDKVELIISYKFTEVNKWEDLLKQIETFKKDYNNIVMETTPRFNPNFDVINSGISKNYDYTIPSNKIEVRPPYSVKRWRYYGWNGTKYYGTALHQRGIRVEYNGRFYGGFNENEVKLYFDVDTPILPDHLYPINNTWEDILQDTYIEIKLWGYKKQSTSITLKNTETNINNLLKNPDLINKFQGIFFLPNLSNFTIEDPRKITGLFNGFAAVEITPHGIHLSNFSICNQLKLNNFQESRLKWNNDFISSILFLKYFDITYYSNSKNWNFYFDLDTTSINLSGKFTFNGVGSIVSNIGIDKTYNNIIEFPYQLPSALDQYTKYYSSIMSSTNTGMEAQKKSYEINKAQHGMNTALSAFSAAPSIAGNIASGNLIGGVSDAISMGSNLGNALLDSKKMDFGNTMYYKNLGAKFSDIQRTQTTNFSNSSITDLSFLFSNTGKFNSEQIQMKSLTKDTIININNHLYLYGYQNIGWYDWSELLPYNNFNYVELERNELVRIVVNDLDFIVRNIYEVVINFWDKGRRIWSKKPNKDENILKVSFRDEK